MAHALCTFIQSHGFLLMTRRRGSTPVVFKNEPEKPLPGYFAEELGWRR
jgi:hypothetical protein